MLCTIFAGCNSSSQLNLADFKASIDFKTVDLYSIKNNNGMKISVSNFRARVLELFVPDKNGNFDDVILGHKSLVEYQQCKIDRFSVRLSVVSVIASQTEHFYSRVKNISSLRIMKKIHCTMV